MLYVGLVIGTLVFAFQAIRATRMMIAVVWLACTSALVAVLLYAVGGREIAIIELSVGAGLVTVLFAFALSLVGENLKETISLIPRPLVWALLIHIMVLLAWLIFPLAAKPAAAAGSSFSDILWQDRSLDVVAQIALIFVGVLGVLGLLVDSRFSGVPAKALTPHPGSRRFNVEQLSQDVLEPHRQSEDRIL